MRAVGFAGLEERNAVGEIAVPGVLGQDGARGGVHAGDHVHGAVLGQDPADVACDAQPAFTVREIPQREAHKLDRVFTAT